MNADTRQTLRLRAEDIEDLQVISSVLQDAIARVADMTFQPRLRRFALVATRFRWERAESRLEGGERIRSGLHFDGVLKVRSHNVDTRDREGLLPLLAIEAEPEDGNVRIRLMFGGDAVIELLAEYVDARLDDLGESWPTPNRPDHGLDDGA